MKKAISLSIEAIILITLAIIFLILFLQLINKTYYQQLDFLERIEQEARNILLENCKSSNERLLLLKDRYKESSYNAIAIKNLNANNDFSIEIKEVSKFGANIDEWFQHRKDAFTIEQDQCVLVGILFKIPANAQSGNYIFDLIVNNKDGKYASAEFSIGK